MIEIIHSYCSPARPRVAVFDFDGTLSLIRSGWMPLMVSMFVDEILPLSTGEEKSQLEDHIRETVLQLTGKETIHQTNALAREVAIRGGRALTGREYRDRFLADLFVLINARRAALRSGKVKPDELIVPGGRAALDLLKREGVELYLASGTEEENVKQEANLLDISRYFGDRIFGARDDGKGTTKAALIERLIHGERILPNELVGFGDGYVEIYQVSKAGGFAIGLATDEPECRTIEQGKRRHLIAAGAHIIMPNYATIEWQQYLFPSQEPVGATANQA